MAAVEWRPFLGLLLHRYRAWLMRTATVVVLQAIVATYVASVVGVAFFLGPYAMTPTGLAAALFGLLYALIPGILTLTALYLWLRTRAVRGWLRGFGCVVGGATGGCVWGGFVLLVTKRPEYFPLRDVAHFLLIHAVPGAAGGLIFWLFTHERMARHAGAMAHDPHS
jgi:hypothetical protein